MEIIGVCGSKKWTDRGRVIMVLDKIKQKIHNFKLVLEGEGNVSKWAEEWALSNANQYEIIKPLSPNKKCYELYAKIEILSIANNLLIFWDNNTKGTQFLLKYARRRVKQIMLITYNKVSTQFR